MVTAAIDIHKHSLQAVVLDGESGELAEQRLAGQEQLADWAMRCRGRLAAVAIEATTGWRWVARELQAAGFDVRLVDPGQAKALQGRKKRAKTDRLDCRWLCVLLAKEMLPQAWLPPDEIQRLRDQTRLRKALADDRRRWCQRLHALLQHEGWSCARERLLSREGRRWVAALQLPAAARAQVELYLRLIRRAAPPRQAGQAGTADAALGTRPGRPGGHARAQPGAGPVQPHQPSLWQPAGEVDRRPQDRPPGLPPPARARG